MMPYIDLWVSLLLAPLLFGLIERTKAFFAGRTGPSLLQVYRDIARLMRKGAVYSRSTSWIFRAGPIVGLASILVAASIVPLGGAGAPLSFDGDLFLFAYLLGLGRFFTVLAALDTASSFEGMGASREVQLAALAEPALLLALAAIAWISGQSSFSAIYAGISSATWSQSAAPLALVCAALLVVFLVENSRIPVDDPNTHLEVTMIHEVMVLDHSGPDLAFITYGATIKLWVLSALIVGIVLPVHASSPWLGLLASIGGVFAIAIFTGIVESSMAKVRLNRVPQLLVGAGALALTALILVLR